VSISLKRWPWCVLPLVVACGRVSDSAKSLLASKNAGRGLGAAVLPQAVAASPDSATELVLPANLTPIALAGSLNGAEVALVVRDTSGKQRVVKWKAGENSTSPIAELPPRFVARAIASHPAKQSLFVTGSVGDTSQIIALTNGGGLWRSAVILKSPLQIGRVIVGTRPFATRDSTRYRLFFAAQLPNGTSSLRSVTETGRVEYQVAGPQSSVVVLKDEDKQPGGPITESAIPLAVHPRGQPLIWQDRRGCPHAVEYDDAWTTDHKLPAMPCGGLLSMTPNGTAFLQWQHGLPGVTIVRERQGAVGRQATEYTFAEAPITVPDGRGVIGIVAKADKRAALVYAPIAMPLADVTNAWQLPANACEEQLFTKNGGFFVEGGAGTQLYDIYDRNRYAGAEVPLLATTDLFWENFGAAFNGVFIVLERRHATAAFWAFVDAANAAMSSSMASEARTTTWAQAFAALAAMHRGSTEGEAGRIANDTIGKTIIGGVDLAELKPRGHYTTSPEMRQYFRAVHFFTELNKPERQIDPGPLSTLPPDVQSKAMEWISVYRPFIAPSRSQLVWSTDMRNVVAPYALHPWTNQSVFPLSWGIDNEALESGVYHSVWPIEQQITGPRGGRPWASGLDVATVFGSTTARSLLAPDLADYPRLGPVLTGITARRPKIDEASSIYERWLEALAVEWADSSKFPGAPTNSQLWSAKRLQTGLASWATIREATILVNERPSSAEAGEGGFEELIPEIPRGYVEPAPATFEAIASLYDALARRVATMTEIASITNEGAWANDGSLRQGILNRLNESSAEARRFKVMAEKELRGEALTDDEYEAIRAVGGSAEHQFKLYKSLAEKDLGIPIPEPMAKIADVAGDLDKGLLEVAVGAPLQWRQIAPYFGRRQIVIGSTYSYYEFFSKELYDNARWRKEINSHARPAWVQSLIAPAESQCRLAASP
jgi:hypothetical protein